ncbi:MAG: sigma-70 family RNA polymerase sigma factor [Anaerolineae bacterium]|nr:sigma-70 family RNA polymerase sigma factor [Phycisphaerae bacterium]
MADAAVTRMLEAIDAGDSRASSELLPLVYAELRKLAERRLKQEKPGQTLQATALVHEAFLRLVGADKLGASEWDSRGHFFAAAAEAMRRILIDRAREKGTIKRGGALNRVNLDLLSLTAGAIPEELLDLDEALKRLAAEDPKSAELVKLRFFAGMNRLQAASALGISPATSDRYWAYARAWLFEALAEKKE